MTLIARNMGFRSRGFVLLEVMISLMILAIALGTSLRSFTHSITSLRKIQSTTTGLFLADQFLTEIDLIPAREGEMEGDFDPDLFPEYYWRLNIEREDIEYESLSFDGELDEFEPLYKYELKIYYDNGRQKAFKVIDAESYMLGSEMFASESKQQMQIF
jgi:prepilin-type N-terminal cleavage/methylation domain-containing protein